MEAITEFEKILNEYDDVELFEDLEKIFEGNADPIDIVWIEKIIKVYGYREFDHRLKMYVYRHIAKKCLDRLEDIRQDAMDRDLGDF